MSRIIVYNAESCGVGGSMYTLGGRAGEVDDSVGALVTAAGAGIMNEDRWIQGVN